MQNNIMNVGILAAGGIAAKMALTLSKMKTARPYAVASRNIGKAQEFAQKFGIPTVYGSYEELANDTNVDLVYIACPHSHHYKYAKMCLEAGKAVLCEKAFTVTAEQAQSLVDLANKKNLLITEAMWIRYMPMTQTIQNIIKSGIIGTPNAVTANLSYKLQNIQRLVSPELAGGALLDLGVYTLNFASIVLGTEIDHISSDAVLTQNKIDAQNAMIVHYVDGSLAILNSSILTTGTKTGVVYGDKGRLIIDNINNFEKITVLTSEGRKIKTYRRPKQITGYEYQVEACRNAIINKKTECSQMPHWETIRIMKIMDSLRERWGVMYPESITSL